AKEVQLTGKKLANKIYYRHSGWPGGLKKTTAADMRNTRPERMIELAVKGMLPKTSLGRRQLRKLKVYAGPEHPHQAQKPEVWELRGLK
ncbi:MAG: 50S ribosomal protein L13, partial [Planifilum fulgidum]